MSAELQEFFDTLLRQAEAKAERTERVTDPDAVIATLRDALDAWNRPNPFCRGDIVRPAPHSSFWRPSLGTGIVLRTHAHEESPNDDHRIISFDMRLLVLGSSGTAHEVQAHSRDFELVCPADGARSAG